MSTLMKRIKLLVAALSVAGMCSVADAQRRDQEDNQNQNFEQNFGGGRRGRGNNQGGGGGRNRQRFNNFGFNSNVEVADGDYSVIATKSIFLRDRRDRTVPTGPARIDPSTLPPEQLLVVTGIVFEEGGFHAYVEHLLQGGLTRLAVGNNVAMGQVVEISIDSLGYKPEGSEEVKWIGVSHNLLGTRVDSIQSERMRLQTMTGTGTAGASFRSEQFNSGQLNSGQFNSGQLNFTARGGQFGNNNNNTGGRGNRGGTQIPVVAPPPLVGDPSMSIEERMRLRRSQEGQPGYQAPPPVVIEAPPVEQVQAQPQAAPAAPGTAVDVDQLQNLTVEERMMLRRQQELGN